MQSSRVLPFFGVFLCGLLAVGCGSSNNNKPDGGGGAGGLAVGGHGGSSGGTGGAGGASGTTGSGGSTGGNPLCSGVQPDFMGASDAGCPAPYVVADFTTDPALIFGPFGSAIAGGSYVNAPLTGAVDPTMKRWNITGPVSTIEGFGLYWQCTAGGMFGSCAIDLSRYRGIEITLKGDVGPSGKMGLSLGRAENDNLPMAGETGCGQCTKVDAGADAGAMCNGPSVRFEVPNDGQDHTVVLDWAMFTGGHPNDGLDPHQLTGSFFFFDPIATDTDGGTDGGTDGDAGGGAAADDAAVADAAADAPFDQDGGADGGPAGPTYTANISIHGIRLVCY